MRKTLSKQFFFFLIAFLFLGSKAFGGIFLEPYIGYAVGFQNYTLKSGSVDQGIKSFATPNGMTVGGRIGLSLGPLYLAGDMSSYVWDGSIPGATPSASAGKWSFSSMGVTAIFSPPVLPLRVWAGYHFSDKMTQEYGSYSFEKTGTSIKFGGSLSLIPLGIASITVNAEYIMTTYGDFALTGSKGSVTIGGDTLTFGDLTQNTVLITVALPFDVPFT